MKVVMHDIRCKKCNKLLAKITGDCRFEIKCNRCSDLYCGEISEPKTDNFVL